MSNRRVPRYFGFRMYMLSILLYILLTLPISLSIKVKNTPALVKDNIKEAQYIQDSIINHLDTLSKEYKYIVDSLEYIVNSPEDVFADHQINKLLPDSIVERIYTLKTKKQKSKNKAKTNNVHETNDFSGKVILIILITAFIFNIPIKRYFKRKRKGKKLKKRHINYVRKFITKSHQINALIFLIPLIIYNLVMYIQMKSGSCELDFIDKKLFIQLNYISFIATILIAIFIYSWQKHRIQFKYIEHVFTAEELKQSIYKSKRENIGRRLLASSVMTTFLPLVIVVFYLVLTTTQIRDLGIKEFSKAQKQILIGDFFHDQELTIGVQYGEENQEDDITSFINIISKEVSDINNYQYINAVDTTIAFLGISISVAIAILYLIFYVKWTKLGITQPVNDLLHKMQKSAKMQLGEFAIVRTNDEVGKLTEGYNKMNQKIRDYVEQITQMNQELEEKVEQRTAEIAQKSEEITAQNEELAQQNKRILEQKQKVEEANHELDVTIQQLKSTQSQLVQSEKMASLGILTAGIAHEINNPINFVSSNTTPLKQDIKDLKLLLDKYRNLKRSQNLNEDLKEIEKLENDLELDFLYQEIDDLMSGITEGATRTKEIVKSLRSFARMDESTVKTVDVHEGIESTLVLLKNKWKNKIDLKRNFNKIPMIDCYPAKLNQVFMNVINNAIDSIMDKGEISISTYKENEMICVSIKDTGCGMDKETQNKIFEPFFTTKSVGKGVGLGLAISYGIIEQHKGEIIVNSTVNVGTEFIIKVPINQEF